IAYDFRHVHGLTVVIVKPELAGKFFHLTRARNIGAQAAKHEVLYFQDADVWVTSSFIERVNNKLESSSLDLLVNRLEASDADVIHKPNTDLPIDWVRDGQCFIKNYLFYSMNGY